MNQLITMSPTTTATRILIDPSGIAKRDALLREARSIVVVDSPASQALANDAQRELMQFARDVEAVRKELKEEPLRLGREVDARAKELAGNSEVEAKRLGGLQGGYHAKLLREQQEAQRQREADEQRIREEAERAEREAKERARLEAEAAAKAAEPETDEEAERQAEEMRQNALREIQDAEERERQKEERIREARAKAALVQAAPKLNGTAMVEDVVFEVTDLAVLYRHNPQLVKLSANMAAIKQTLKGLTEGTQVPGLDWHREAKAVVR